MNKGDLVKKGEGLVVKQCIVCREDIWWDMGDLPPACFEHHYGEVVDAMQDIIDEHKKANP